MTKFTFYTKRTLHDELPKNVNSTAVRRTDEEMVRENIMLHVTIFTAIIKYSKLYFEFSSYSEHSA